MTSTVTPASFGVHGPGESTIADGASVADFVDADRVVAPDDDLGAELAEVLDEVVGEGVVVVDDEDHALRRCGRRELRVGVRRDLTSGYPLG